MKDGISNVKFVNIGQFTSSDFASIDRQGFNSVCFLFSDSGATTTIKESDDGILFNDVNEDFLFESYRRVGYTGYKRYVGVDIQTTGAPIMIGALLGKPNGAPVE